MKQHTCSENLNSKVVKYQDSLILNLALEEVNYTQVPREKGYKGKYSESWFDYTLTLLTQAVWAEATRRIFVLHVFSSPVWTAALTFPPQLLLWLHKPSVHTLPAPTLPSLTPSVAPWRSKKSLTAAAKVAEVALKRSKRVCVHDYAGNKGLRVTGYNDGKCEAWARWEKQSCSAQLPQLGCVPTKTRNTPLGGWLEQSDAPIHTYSKKGTWSQRCDKWTESWTLKC